MKEKNSVPLIKSKFDLACTLMYLPIRVWDKKKILYLIVPCYDCGDTSYWQTQDITLKQYHIFEEKDHIFH